MKKIISLGLFLTLLVTGCGLQSTAGSTSPTQNPNPSAQTQPQTGDATQSNGSTPAAPSNPPTATNPPSATSTTGTNQPPAANPQPVISNPPPGAESVTPDTVVKEYYGALERGAYHEAWSFMHPSVQANPSGFLTEANFTADQKKWTAKLVQVQTIQLLDQYKIYSVQISFANVEVVKATFDNGQTKMIHLVLDEHNSWKMFWGADGIE